MGARAPRGHQRGAKKKEKRKGKEREGRKEEKKGKRKKKGKKEGARKLDQYDERGAMQFQVQAGAPGKKTSGAPNRQRKGREGCHAVSSASRGFREENVRGAKLTEKRTRGGAMQFQMQAGAPGKKTSGAPN